MTNTRPSSPVHPPLRRPIDDRAFAGVASGLARRFDISPTLLRVGFVILALFGGIGIFLYIAGWLLIPEEGSDDPLLTQWVAGFDTSNTGMVIGVVLIGIAILVLFSRFHLFSGRFFLAAILLVVGVMLYRGDVRGSKRGPIPPPPTAGTADAHGKEAIMADDAEGTDTTTDVGAPLLRETIETPERPVPVVPPVPPREPRPRSILGRLTVAASLIGIGVLALLHTADIVEPDPVHYFALVLAVVGAGLLVGALFGRARWLIAVGILLLPIVWIASVGPTWTINNEVGEYHYQIETLADLDAYAAATGEGSGYEIAVGSLQLDLTNLDLDAAAQAGPIPIAASVGVGEVIIRLPSGSTAAGEASVGIGSVTVFGDQSAGLGVSRDFEAGADATFSIDASAGIGTVVVTTERAPISIRRSTGWEG